MISNVQKLRPNCSLGHMINIQTEFRKALKMSLRGAKRLRGETEANSGPFLYN